MFDYDPESKKAVEILDKYDISQLLKNCHGVNLSNLSELFENYSCDVYAVILNLSPDELEIYLIEKYSVRIEEVTERFVYWMGEQDV